MFKNHLWDSSIPSLVAGDGTTGDDFSMSGDTASGTSDVSATVVKVVVPAVVVPPVITDVLYLTEGGNGTPISYTDINQDGIGDCFLVSQLGELALTQPSFITNMIHVNANGTETVTLHSAGKSGAAFQMPTSGTSSFTAFSETVTNVFAANSVNSGTGQDVVGNQKEIWAQVIEKAYATAVGGYANIQNGGYPTQAMEVLTGQKATDYAPTVASTSFAWLAAAVKADDMITMDTGSGGTYGLYGDHCYMFTGVTGTTTANAMVHLANPWGIDQPAAIPLTQLAHAVVQIDVCHA